jgi:hypothetical protein
MICLAIVLRGCFKKLEQKNLNSSVGKKENEEN